MKKLMLAIAFCLGLTASNAQNAKTIKQLNGRTVSTEALTTRLNQLLDSAEVAGLQVVILNNKKPVWAKSFGFKDVERQMPLNDSTVMYAASLTKAVFGYLFMRLVDKGILDLDKPIRDYLKLPITEYPKWKQLGEDTVSFDKITPRMILSHSSGMPVLRSEYGDQLRLIAKPGEKFYYSNEGMNLLGFVMEEYTGKSLKVWTIEEVFGPLQMKHTSMVWEPEFEKNFSYAYFKDGKKYGSERRESTRAAGSMTTTAADYAKFVANLMNKKGLSKKGYDQLLSPQILVKSKRGFGPLKDTLTTDNDRIELAWGMGIGLFKSPDGTAFFHTGRGEANINYMVAYPDKGIAVVLLSNSENYERVYGAVLEACIGDKNSPLTWLGLPTY
ncbi:serine hydrolase domain-containing protein [Pedobacter gandavensis]|uniref:serine hydrolase domain-containing protein n=1 Tax=Pedobacter gandavensis TaxID=2679963 RepID=UPI002478B4AA|nr:serine hydrolase domain-containing protein [Pedobacter gandavensis]WGQ10064.1 serine hydrolase domain-containing protein [Pedobacter gandavensis]